MFCSLRLLNRTDILAVLATFTTVRKRMISRVNVWESVPSLQILARDAMLIGLIDNNQERLVSSDIKPVQGWNNVSQVARTAKLP